MSSGDFSPEAKVGRAVHFARRRLPLVLIAMMLFIGTARGQVVVWNGGTGNWDQGPVLNYINWGLGAPLFGVLPAPSDAVAINTGTVTLNIDSTIQALTVGASGGVAIIDGQVLTIASPGSGGTLSNAGTITFSSTGTATKLRLSGGDLNLTGGGTLTLGNNASNII